MKKLDENIEKKFNICKFVNEILIYIKKLVDILEIKYFKKSENEILNVCIVESYLPLLIYSILKKGKFFNTIFVTSDLSVKEILKNEKVIWVKKENYLDGEYKNHKMLELRKYVKRVKKILKISRIKFFGSNHVASYYIFDHMINKITILDDGLSLYNEESYPAKCSIDSYKVEKVLLLGFQETLEKMKKKSKIISLKEKYNKLNFFEKRKVLKLFDITKLDIKKMKKSNIIFFTQPLSEDGVLNIDEEIKLYKKLFEKYDNKKILIKTHPREKKKYEEIFANKENIEIFDKKVPIEIFDILNVKFDVVSTIFSTAILTIKANKKEFFGTSVHPKIEEVFGKIEI